MPNSADIDISTANPKQLRFFKSRKRFVAYGGARGGGKSWSLREKAVLLAVRYAGIHLLILRRTYPELQQNHINELQKMTLGFAKYKKQDKILYFPNGSEIKFGYCKSESDVLQYQGQEYDVIFIDEATQFTFYQYQTLTACLRGANDFPKRMYLTCNPGGVGHEWVKRLFISKRYEKSENPNDYEFISATVYDNKILLEKDPSYVKTLENLSDGLREAWLDGNWDMLAGQYFSEFNRNIHVIEPFEIPPHWRRYRAIDYGLDCLACVWIAIDESGGYYVYREYAKPDMIISDGAKEITELSGDEKIEYTAAPTDLWGRSQESAKCKADLFFEGGLPLIKSSNNREAGWLAVKDLLKPINGESRLKIFSSCEELIEQLPALQRSQKKPTDCMTEPHEITHLPDSLRYFVLQYITPSAAPKEEKTEVQKYRDRVLKNKRRNYF